MAKKSGPKAAFIYSTSIDLMIKTSSLNKFLLLGWKRLLAVPLILICKLFLREPSNCTTLHAVYLQVYMLVNQRGTYCGNKYLFVSNWTSKKYFAIKQKIQQIGTKN